MNDHEINQIIAKFMGYRWEGGYTPGTDYTEMVVRKRGEGPNSNRLYVRTYTKSLDELAIVWAKMDVEASLFLRHTAPIYPQVLVKIYGPTYKSEYLSAENIQLAAARATANAIKNGPNGSLYEFER